MGEYEIRDDFCGHINGIAEKMCIESQLQESLEFVDISTLEERLIGENSITHEFTDKISGWNRSRFIPVDYDEDGKLLMKQQVKQLKRLKLLLTRSHCLLTHKFIM